jgi:hypothetical protein
VGNQVLNFALCFEALHVLCGIDFLPTFAARPKQLIKAALSGCGEMADTLDLGSSAVRHGGSSPSTRTKGDKLVSTLFVFFLFQHEILVRFAINPKSCR